MVRFIQHEWIDSMKASGWHEPLTTQALSLEHERQATEMNHYIYMFGSPEYHRKFVVQTHDMGSITLYAKVLSLKFL